MNKRIWIVVWLLAGVWLWPIQGSAQQQQSARQQLKERFQQRNIQFDAGQQSSSSSGWEQTAAPPPAAVPVGGRDNKPALDVDELTVSGTIGRIEPAPVRYAIYQSEYRVEIEEEIAKVQGTVTLEVFAKAGGAAIPLANTSVGLSDVTINRRPSVVTRRGNRYVLLVDKAGKYTVELEFFVKLSREREHGPGQFAFETLPSPISLIDVELPQPEMDLFVEPSIKLEKETVANKTLATAVLPYTEQVNIRWSPAARRIEIPSVKLEPRLHAEAETLISVGEGVAQGTTRLRYSILQAEVSDFRILLPGDVTVLSVQGNDVRDWKVLPKESVQAVEVYLAHGVKGAYDLRLEYEQTIGEGSVTAQLPEITALGVEREAGVVGIQARTNVEVALSRLKDAVEIDVKELPASLWQQASHPILLAYKYLKHPCEAEMAITRHKEVSVLVAAIDSASYITLLTDEGKMLTGATFQMRNNVQQFMRLNLPEGATFLSCFVSGNPVKPAQDEAGRILVPLEKSETLGENVAQFPVEIMYLTRQEKLSPAGQLRMALPQMDIPTSQLLWAVYFPETFNFFNFQGDVKLVKAGRTGLPVDLLLRGRSRQTAEMAQQVSVSGFQMMQHDEAKTFKRMESSYGKGALPIKIAMPTVGNAVRFSKLLVTEERPWLSVWYVRNAQAASGPIGWVIFLLVLGVVGIGGGRAIRSGGAAGASLRWIGFLTLVVVGAGLWFANVGLGVVIAALAASLVYLLIVRRSRHG